MQKISNAFKGKRYLPTKTRMTNEKDRHESGKAAGKSEATSGDRDLAFKVISRRRHESVVGRGTFGDGAGFARYARLLK